MRRVFFLMFLALLPATAAAQSALDSIPIQIGVSPENPRPGDTVTLAISGNTGSDLASFTWSVNGTVVLQGVGARNLSLKMGALGQTTDVTVDMNDRGEQNSGEILLSPSTVDLVWEGQTYTPPLYLGRPLPNGGSTITLLAVPHIISNGKEIPISNFVYTWKVNGGPLAGKSGYGKAAATVTPPQFDEAFTVSVHAETTDGSQAADNTVTIEPQRPKLVFYEIGALSGIQFQKSLSGEVAVPGDEISFSAEPFFVSSPDSLLLQWSLDGKPVAVDPQKPRDITFRKTGADSGTHSVDATFKNNALFLEHGEAGLKLSF